MKVAIHNTDGVNPYATEIATMLARRRARVTLIDARNGEHRPPDSVRWRRVLPANFGGESPLRQVVLLTAGILTTAWRSVVHREVVIVAATRFPIEDLALAGLARMGRPVLMVLHNPEPRVDESAFRGSARRALLRRATSVIVHAERLRTDVDPIVGDRLRVCPHPPYVHSTATATTPATPPTGQRAGAEPADGGGVDADRRWLAYIGNLRWDKGSDLLAPALALVPEPERRRLGLVVCGRGALPDGDWERIAALGVATRDLSSAHPIPQDQLLAVLASRPLVLAPYVAATQSGSVILALSMGCRVLAFDQGGIPDVVSPDGLVATGDLDAFARAIADDRAGHALQPLDEWEAHAGAAWHDAVAAGGSTR